MEQTKPFDAVLKRLKKAQPAQRKLIKEMSKEWESMDKESIETSNVVLESTVKEEPNSYPSNSNEKKDESENCNSDQCESPDWSEFEGCFAKDLMTGEGSAKTARFLSDVIEILLRYVKAQRDSGNKVLDFHHPHQLREMMDHCLDVDEIPRDLEQILSDCKETLKYCVKTAHPRFLNQFSTGLDIIGLAGEWLTATANTNMFTYEVAPVFTLMESIILTRMRKAVGWEEGKGDGIFAPGGAISNLYGLLCARHCACPEIKSKGMSASQELVVFTSEQSHFSIKRAAILLGIGLDNVVDVQTDERGKMNADDLEDKINTAKIQGKFPIFVNATMGTTVLGAYDPLEKIADICEAHGLWLHADGAWGGTLLMAEEHKHLLKGIERVNSMTWNPHKMMGTPLQCSAILLRDEGILQDVNQLGANYLFQKDKHYDVSYDTGDKAIQCGRHNDVFKLWLMWRSKGDKGFEEMIAHHYDIARYLMNQLRANPNFELVIDEIEAPCVCFWYMPPHIRALPAGMEREVELNKIAPKLKALMMECGTMMLAYQPLGKLPNFFRVAVSNPLLRTEDIDFVMSEIERLAKEL
ncbi:hypothetical protein ScPMuIL_012728 [Solemya velum]